MERRKVKSKEVRLLALVGIVNEFCKTFKIPDFFRSIAINYIFNHQDECLEAYERIKKCIF